MNNEFTLYTVGYANRKLLEFKNLLRKNGVSLVIDVRLPESGAWTGKYKYGPEFMGKTLFPDFYYVPAGHAWGNIFLEAMLDKTDPAASLKYYKEWLGREEIGRRATTWAHLLLKYYDHEHVPCLLCAERDVYQKDAKGKANCHRLLVAEKLARWITDITKKACEIEHI